MQISYIKSWDNEGYVITQSIRAENKNESELLKDCLTNYSIQQNKENVYSVGVKAISTLRNVIDNKRILYRNTYFII